jgi:biotin synthase-related radical SAM superfamily protein
MSRLGHKRAGSMSEKRKVTLDVSKKRKKDGKTFFVINIHNSGLRPEWIEIMKKDDTKSESFISSMATKIGLSVLKLIEYKTKPGPIEYRMVFNTEYIISGKIYGSPGDNKKWVDFKIPITKDEVELFLFAMYEVSELTY